MKKVLFALCAALTLGFVACGDPENPGEPATDVVITIDPSSLELTPGDETRLKTIIEPAGTTVKVSWKSSNEAVATVTAAGLVTAVGEGTATITASAEGAKAGTCEVVVSATAVYNSFDISDYGMFGAPTIVEGSDTVITASSGDQYNCKMAYFTMYAYSSGIAYVDGKGLQGEGFLVASKMPVWVAVDENGELLFYFRGVLRIQPKAPVQPYYAEAGAVNVDEFAKFMKSVVAAENDTTLDWDEEAYKVAFTGASIDYFNSSYENTTWYDICPVGHVKSLAIGWDDDDALLYTGDIVWHEFLDDNYWFGLKMNFDEEGYFTSVVEPYEFKTIEKHVANFDESAAAFERPLDMSKFHAEDPFGGKRANITNKVSMYKK